MDRKLESLFEIGETMDCQTFELSIGLFEKKCEYNIRVRSPFYLVSLTLMSSDNIDI